MAASPADVDDVWCQADELAEAEQFAEALELYERVERELVSAGRERDALDVACEVAVCLTERGSYDGAIAKYRSAAQGYERLDGAGSEEVLDALTRAVGVAKRACKKGATGQIQGQDEDEDVDRVTKLLEEILAASVAAAGGPSDDGNGGNDDDDEAVLIARANLAAWVGTAEQLVAAAEGLEQGLGPDHPQTLAGFINAAAALEDAGNVEQAVSVWRKVVAGRAAGYGPDHPATAVDEIALANALTQTGAFGEAASLVVHVVRTAGECGAGSKILARMLSQPAPALMAPCEVQRAGELASSARLILRVIDTLEDRGPKVFGLLLLLTVLAQAGGAAAVAAAVEHPDDIVSVHDIMTRLADLVPPAERPALTFKHLDSLPWDVLTAS